jgi:hypothetical protein
MQAMGANQPLHWRVLYPSVCGQWNPLLNIWVQTQDHLPQQHYNIAAILPQKFF